MHDQSTPITTPSLPRTGLAAAFALTAALATGCHSGPKAEPSPQTAQVSETHTARAKILSVDHNSRLMVLQSQDGNNWIVRAGPAVRNFDQITAGDSVRVGYVASLAVEIKKPDEPIVPASAAIGAGRAKPGEMPAAGIGAQLTATVKIESVDLTNNLVVFTTTDGGLHVVNVQRPEGRQFIRGLKKGDMVEITYTEAVAIEVEKQ